MHKHLRVVLLACLLPLEALALWFVCGLYQTMALRSSETFFFPSSVYDIQAFAFRQTLCLVGLFLLGYFLLWLFRGALTGVQRALFAFPCGLVLVFAGGISVLSLHIPYTLASLLCSVAILLGACALAAFLLKKRTPKNQPQKPAGKSVEHFLLLLALVLAAACLCVLAPTRYISSDSARYFQLQGAFMATRGEILYFTSLYTFSVGPLQPLLSTLPVFLSFAQTFGFQQLLALNTALFFAYLVWQALPAQKRASLRVVLALAISAAAFLQPVVVIISSWLLSNVYSMAFLFFAAGICYLLSKQQNKGADGMLALGACAIGLCFSRIEGMFLLLLVFLAAIPLSFTRTQLAGSLLAAPLPLLALYYGNLLFIANAERTNVFLNGRRLAFMALVFAVAIAYTWFLRDRNFLRTKTHAWPIGLIGLAALNLLALAMDPAHYYANLSTTASNILRYDFSGLAAVCFVAYAILLVYDRFRLAFFDVVAIGYLLLAFALFAYRSEPLRVGFGDSALRLMMQFLPILCLAITMKLLRLFKERNAGKQPLPKTEPALADANAPRPASEI